MSHLKNKFIGYLKPFNCLSFSLAMSIHSFAQSYCEATYATIMQRLLLLYRFWLAEICICHKPRQRQDARPTNCTSKDAHASVFSILLTSHTQDTFVLVLNFGVGHFARHFLLLYFFPLYCYERNSFHTASLSHFISLIRLAHHLFFIQPGTVARFA